MTWDTTPPPISFATGDLYTKPLRVYLQGGWLWVYDGNGYLCRIGNGPEAFTQLTQLLAAEASRPSSDHAKRYYHHSARNLVHPGHAEIYEKKMLEVEESINKAAAERRAKPKVQIDLQSLGLLGKNPASGKERG